MSGLSNEQWARYLQDKSRLNKWMTERIPDPIQKKEFVQKHPSIPIMTNYKGKLPNSYWSKWTKRTYNSLTPTKSWICPDKLMRLAQRSGYIGREDRLKRVVKRLRHGANIGCKGAARLPTREPNSCSATEHGAKVADALQDWITDGLCFGPLLPVEMP